MKVYLFFALAVLLSVQPAVAQTIDPVVTRLQSKYDALDGMRAEFTQSMESEYLDEPEWTEGIINVLGDGVRVETGDQTFVTDGVITWLFNRSAGEVLINDYIAEDMFPVRELLFDHDALYEVQSVTPDRDRGSAVHVLHLQARDESSIYRSVALSIRDVDDLISRIEIVDVNDTRLVIELDSIELNPEFPDDTFSFTPPEGANIIDLRS